MAAGEPEAVLEARGVSYAYGGISALSGVDLTVGSGQAVCVVGPNGAGKSTLVKVLAGILQPQAGRVLFRGRDLRGLPPSRMAALGIGVVLEGRRLFTEQSVQVNLELGAYSRALDRRARQDELGRVFELFPALRDIADHPAGSLSGGQQQMLAIGRALMAAPRLLILDEPSMGLAPRVAGEVYTTLARLQQDGLAILLVEQSAPLAFRLAQHGCLLQHGRVVLEGPVSKLSRMDLVQEIYLGRDDRVPVR